MDGAALSNLLSYGLYYMLIIATVIFLCRVQVIDGRWWLILLLLTVLFDLITLWRICLPSMNIWVDSLLRSFVFLGGGAVITYAAELSPERNSQIRSFSTPKRK
jgi:hypothetical protein